MQLRLHVSVYREPVWYFESKERLNEACVFCQGVHNLRSFYICCRFITGLLFLYFFSSSNDQNPDRFCFTIHLSIVS